MAPAAQPPLLTGPELVGWEPRAHPKAERKGDLEGRPLKGSQLGETAPGVTAGLLSAVQHPGGVSCLSGVWVSGTETCTAAHGFSLSVAHIELFPFHFLQVGALIALAGSQSP